MKKKSFKDIPLVAYISFVFLAIVTLTRSIYRKIKKY